MSQGLLNYQKLMQQMNPSPESQAMAAQGGDMINTLRHQQTAQMPPEPSLMQRMGQGVKDFTNDKGKMANLAASMNSMVINPNEFYNQNAKDVKAEQMQKMKQQEAQSKANQTLKYFHDNGRPDLVDAVQNGYSINDAMNEFRKSQQGGQTPAEVQTFDSLTKGMSEEDVDMAKRIRLGLDPRAANDSFVDVGGVPHVMDRRLNELVPVQLGGKKITAQNVADNKNLISSSGSRSDAKTEKIINAEQSILTSQSVLGTLDSMLGEHKEAVMSRTGGIQGRMPAVTEGQALGQSYIDQVMGQSFMEAYKSLKGGGQITEVEGKAATAALQRLGTQTMSDDAYMDAIKELQDIATAGLHRSQGLLSNDINNLVNMYAD